MKKTNALIRNADRQKSNFHDSMSALVGEHKTTQVPNARGVLASDRYFPGVDPAPDWKEFFE